ncbi:PA0061/PA0062 family lipoprotein [Entomomonas asaccharolytica]|uniref:Lipoprotein n=1 Tax=Entomomonas asaccharolytica TaxID=2785331 RepID=A0A974RVY7_9GAMM|nr:hypothetical protein [Entomomonas asaccharolytica]QQP84605.1 hypothetical protein JHT90_09295 [Entomomonas asaccharolytica]
MKKINLNSLVLLLTAGLLTACTSSPIPQPTADTAIVEMYAQPSRSLMADTLDRQRVNDGRYFKVPAGSHRLAVRFQYETAEVTGVFRDRGYITCLMSFNYDFEAGVSYRLEARPMVTGAQLLISKGDNTKLFDFSEVDVRCGPY